MKKSFLLLFAALMLMFAPQVSASETGLSLNLTINDNGAIVIPETARFNIFRENGEWLANSCCEIFSDTKNAAVNFSLPEYEPGTVFNIVPTVGITELSYSGNTYKIGDTIKLDTSLSTNFDMTAVPLFVPPTGIKTDRVTFYFDVQNKATPIASAARFNLFDKNGEWLANDAVKVTNGGERVSLTFYLPEYYTGDTFYLCPTVGMTSISYNGRTYAPNEMIELQTYAYKDDAGVTQVGNYFHLNLVPLFKMPQFDAPGAFGQRATAFVNSSGVASKTNYLVWVSKKDYKVTVFLGEAGNWQYVKSFDCAIGAPSTPTITGQFEYYQKQAAWKYDTYYVGPVMRFAAGGYAIHSTLLRYNGAAADGRVRMKISHGCVRVAPPGINWLAEYIPLHTRVYVTE